MRTKYPRTMNLPYSNSNSSDDVWLKDDSLFDGKQIVVTEKLDGECTTVYPDGYVHARSVDTSHHPSRSWVKSFVSQWAHDIPKGMRVCGENVYAFHSILYTELPTYFFVYGIYDENNLCIPWNEVVEICGCLGLHTVPVLYTGDWASIDLMATWTGKGTFPTFGEKAGSPINLEFPDHFEPTVAEGFVIRDIDGFHYDEFRIHCAKWVRENHVQTTENWLMRPVFANLLKSA